MDDVLDVNDLSVRFGSTQVFANLTFQVARGSSLAIIGPNGAGKTVLFRALIGAIQHEGSVRWAPGVHLGYVPQKLDLERGIPVTGADFLRARAAVARRQETGVSGHEIEWTDTLELVGVPLAVAELPIGTLSGGQFQRLLIAFALLGDPDVLLLDEPTAGVDEPGQDQLNTLVRRLQRDRGLSVLFISHDLSVVSRYATNVLCLGQSGAWIGPPRQILTPDLLHEAYGTAVGYHVHEH